MKKDMFKNKKKWNSKRKIFITSKLWITDYGKGKTL